MNYQATAFVPIVAKQARKFQKTALIANGETELEVNW